MLKVGDPAPDFELKDDEGRTVRLSEVLKDGPLVLYFYPADFTPTCSHEACMFRDAYAELAERGIRVIGVNAFPARLHAEFRARNALPFPLLSDRGREVTRKYGAAGILGFVRRISYLIGRDGRILDAVHANLALEAHKDFLVRVLEHVRPR